ncbi:MAG: divergent PAP2 family protein [Erysipelotrichaceae bacterium]|nr:divergent PAP2 family protein [Erysipelotrichaceae bacterium]MCI9524945.1 divergent PAP2 family protein [Erysipelotrichaceae bacterium]
MDSFYPICAAISANLIAQILKPLFLYRKTKQFDIHQTIASGGFPSSHSSTVSALSTAIGLQQGFHSIAFAISIVFSIIVIYDAVNVRYYAGRNIQLTKQLISDLEKMEGIHFSAPIYEEKIKAVLGHKFIEAIGGILLGIVIACFFYYIFVYF